MRLVLGCGGLGGAAGGWCNGCVEVVCLVLMSGAGLGLELDESVGDDVGALGGCGGGLAAPPLPTLCGP